jgi:diguanylate cyclase (GGDEF)-like protein
MNLFIYGLERAMVRARRENGRLAVISLDLDQFMQINDTMSHDSGDRLLMNIVTRLIAGVRETDLICRGDYVSEECNISRHGGNEFAVVVDNISDISDAARVAERLIEALSQPDDVDGCEVVLTPFAGISIFPDDGDDVKTLLKNAHTAQHDAREAGRNVFRFYALEMNTRALERLEFESELRKAVEREELVLNYQPLVETQNGKLASMEALVRWHSCEFGLVSPACFIPIAEDTGLITSVGRWVVGEAVGQVRAWSQTNLRSVTVSVNLSSRQFSNGTTLLSMIREAIEEAEISPEQLQFELTERTIMDNVDAMIQILRDLKDLGCSLSVDDFGTGYSSFSYLKRLPLDVLKIDRSFVEDIASNADDAAITDAIIAMGHRLNLKIVAEGVETQEQFDLLRDQGVDVVQGFLFSKPLPADEFLAFSRRTWPSSER